ncbi:hypothetical protein CITRIK5_20246 [Citricoccus sp. K5]|nr:hypothetical protein CITRIK5_20246 [Citricoccus sp. K5]
MRWLDMWFGVDETDWPQDPGLDVSRDAVWQLALEGQTRGWVTTSVMPMRALPIFWGKQERVLARVHWVHGRHEYCEEDYGPNGMRWGNFTAGTSPRGIQRLTKSSPSTRPLSPAPNEPAYGHD